MKHTICALTLAIATTYTTDATAYSGELWLSQANQRFGEPASMLAHGFLAGVVHSWNNRRDRNSATLCFKDYISDKGPDLDAPAQGIIRVAMMGRFPCRDEN
jgi:hypothetical protein